jgi:hypothetical protein
MADLVKYAVLRTILRRSRKGYLNATWDTISLVQVFHRIWLKLLQGRYSYRPSTFKTSLLYLP